MQKAAFQLDEYRFTKASSKWLMALSSMKKQTSTAMNHSTHMNLPICTWPIQSLAYKLKRTRVLFLGAAITISATSFAQKHVIENVAKKDSVCRKEQKALSDTTALYLYLRFQGFSPLILKRKEQEKRFNPKALSWPKFDPDKEKFNNLQLINILGEHLLR